MKDSIATMQIVDCMTPFLLTLSKYDTLAAAYEKMTVNQIRRMPVVNHDRLIGILSLSDILRFKPDEIRRYLTFKELSESMDKVIVELVMTTDPIVVYQTDQVGYAAELMLDKKIGGLPVLDSGRSLVGLITESDIFRLLAKEWRNANASNS
ncbi:MAG: acetoin utilization protein AcuB [Gammaproteobacteria bacterium]|jgi:acetoin utilization protein AcuB